MILEAIEKDAIARLRAADPETAQQFINILERLTKDPDTRDKFLMTPLGEITEAIRQLVYFSGVAYHDAGSAAESEKLIDILIREH